MTRYFLFGTLLMILFTGVNLGCESDGDLDNDDGASLKVDVDD